MFDLARTVFTASVTALVWTWPAQADWQPWESLGGTVRSLPDCQQQGQTIDCWALGPANPGPVFGSALAWLRGDGETWQEWQYLGGALRAAPECVSRGNEIHCFAALAQSQGNGLGHITFDGQDWSEWESLGGAVRQKPACLAGPGQQITCLALGLDATSNNGLWYYEFDGQDWQPATLLAFPSGVTATLRPMCTDTAGGMVCFEADTNDQLWSIRRDNGGTWDD